MLLLKRKHETGIGNPRASERADRSRGDCVDTNALRAEIDRKITNRRLERRLGDAHGVVIRHGARSTIVGERHHGAASWHKHRSALGDLGEGKTGNHHRTQKIFARRVGVTPLQLVLVGKGDGMHDKVERAPLLAEARKYAIDGRYVLDIAGQYDLRPDRLGERHHTLTQRLSLKGERELRLV